MRREKCGNIVESICMAFGGKWFFLTEVDGLVRYYFVLWERAETQESGGGNGFDMPRLASFAIFD